MKITIDLPSLTHHNRAKLRVLLQQELATTLDLERFKVKYPAILKAVSLRKLRREARDLRKAVRTLERYSRKGGGS